MIALGLAFFAAGLLAFLLGYGKGRRSGRASGFVCGYTRGVVVTARAFASASGVEFVEIEPDGEERAAEGKPN